MWAVPGWVPVLLEAHDLQHLCAQHGATTMHGALGLWASFLCRQTGQDAVVVGIPYANRSHREIQDVIGYFVNTIAVLVKMDRNQNFEEILQTASHAVLTALEHGETPFVLVVQCLCRERQANRTPLYQTMVGWTQEGVDVTHDSKDIDGKLATVQATENDYEMVRGDSSSKLEIEIDLSFQSQQLAGGISYAAELYHCSTVRAKLVQSCSLMRCSVCRLSVWRIIWSNLLRRCFRHLPSPPRQCTCHCVRLRLCLRCGMRPQSRAAQLPLFALFSSLPCLLVQ